MGTSPVIGSTTKNKSVEQNNCCLWTKPRHFKYTLPSANMRIYLNRLAYPRNCCEESDWFRIQTSELSLIGSKTCTLPSVYLCEEVDIGQLAYATICDKSDCFSSMLLFFFVEPIHGWSNQGTQFFLILKEFYTDMKKEYFFKNLFFTYFFNIQLRFIQSTGCVGFKSLIGLVGPGGCSFHIKRWN